MVRAMSVSNCLPGQTEPCGSRPVPSDFPHPVAVRLPPTHRAALKRIAERSGLTEGKLALRELMAATERLATVMVEADSRALLSALEAEREAYDGAPATRSSST